MTPAPTTAEHWRRIEEIVDTLLAIPGPQRKTALQSICASDDHLREEVEALLNEEDESDPEDSPLISRIIEDATVHLLEEDA